MAGTPVRRAYLFPFILFSFLLECIAVYPVYMIMFRDRGFTFTGLAWLMVIWSLPVVLLEVPSGILADRWSRKKLILAGTLLKGGGYLVWALWPGYAAAAAGFALWGVQEAFCSGSRQALLFETLREHGEASRYESAAGICAAASTAGTVIALVAGGFLYSVDEGLPVILSIAAAGAAIVPALFFREKRISAGAGNCGGPGAEGRDDSRGHRNGVRNAIAAAEGLVALLIAACVAGGAYGSVDEYDGLIAVESFGIPVRFVGLWGALRFALEGVGGMTAGPLTRLLDRIGRRGLPGGLVAAGLLIAVSTVIPGPARIALYLSYYLFMASLNVVLEGRLNRAVDDSGRATLLSLSSLGITLAAIALSPLFGFSADRFGIVWIVRITGMAGVAAGLLYMAVSRRS